MNDKYEDKYEYIFPEITFDKNILTSDKLGGVDLQTSFKVHNYDTNKFTSFFVNNLDWESNDLILILLLKINFWEN